MRKIIVSLSLALFLTTFVSASCSDIDIEITEMSRNGFMQGKIYGDESQVRQIKVYVDDELRSTGNYYDIKEDFGIPPLHDPYATGQEIRIALVLQDDSVCENKYSFTVSADRFGPQKKQCDLSAKKNDWCIGDKVYGMKCSNGEWGEFIDVDCELRDSICDNGQCVDKGPPLNNEEETKNSPTIFEWILSLFR